jgi:peptidyl-prolyl cis-trans isomerase C
MKNDGTRTSLHERPARAAALAAIAGLLVHTTAAAQFIPPPTFQRPGVPTSPTGTGAPAISITPSRMAADAVLADNGVVRITRADYDLELQRLPAEVRGGFPASERRVADLIARMLTTRTLAHQADAAGLPNDPENARKLASELERAKAQLMIARLELDAAKRFDADTKPWEARARDVYLTNRAKYEIPEEVTVSHILFSTEKRPVDEAMRLALAARARLAAGTEFAALAKELSDEPAAQFTGGSLGAFSRGKMVPEFEEAAFALEPGALSPPVKTRLGVHVIRLEKKTAGKKQTLEEAKPAIMAELRQSYVHAQRDEALAAIQDQARAGTNLDLVQTMVIRVDPAAIEQIQRDAAQQQTPQGQPRNRRPISPSN